MKKKAFMFPGQGSQYIGMGQDFYNEFTVSRDVYKLASEITGIDIPSLCFEENNMLNITKYTQIALLTTEIAILEDLKENGIMADASAGLSLGEYTSLVYSNALCKEDVFRLVQKRGEYMQDAVPYGGMMKAIVGLDSTVIESICRNATGIVSIANYNSPRQVVISGEEVAVTWAGDECLKSGASSAISLNVSGPFHSIMLKDASEKMKQELIDVNIRPIEIPYVSNVNAKYIIDEKEVKDILIRQIFSPVLWKQSIEFLIQDGVDEFIEVGPGKSLSGFVKKIDRSKKVVSINSVQSLNKYMKMYV